MGRVGQSNILYRAGWRARSSEGTWPLAFCSIFGSFYWYGGEILSVTGLPLERGGEPAAASSGSAQLMRPRQTRRKRRCRWRHPWCESCGPAGEDSWWVVWVLEDGLGLLGGKGSG